jgi:hypothetical protein
MIEESRAAVAQTVNSTLVLLHWPVGAPIRADVLRHERAANGEPILPIPSAKIAPEYGQSIGERNLACLSRFAEVFPDRDIVLALSRQLGWSHFVEIIPLKSDLHREVYAEICCVERWSVQTLRDKTGACPSSGPPFRASLSSWPGKSWPSSARRTRLRPTWSSATPISSHFVDLARRQFTKGRLPQAPRKRLLLRRLGQVPTVDGTDEGKSS